MTRNLPFVWLAAGTVLLAACAPSIPSSTAPPPEPTAAATSTPFLPRGFVLPGTRAATPPAALVTTSQAEPSPVGLGLSTMLARLNRLRADEGVAPLAGHASLDRIADERAQALADAGALSHTDSDAAQAMQAAGFSGAVAEVALSVRADESDLLGSALQALLTDPANRAIVLGPAFRHVGLGIQETGGAVYLVGLLAQSGPEG